MRAPGTQCPSREDLEALGRLARTTEVSKGGSPSYSLWHVVRALEELSKGPIGRPALVLALGLGESSVKTLLSRLEAAGLAAKLPRGHGITAEGRRLLDVLGRYVRVLGCSIGPLPDFGECEAAVVRSEPPLDLVDVYAIRDYLVSRGCKTAIIGYLREGDVGFPGLPPDIQGLILASLPRGDLARAGGEGAVLVTPKSCEAALVEAAVELVLSCNPPVNRQR